MTTKTMLGDGSGKRPRYWWILAAVVLAGCIGRLVHFHVALGSDDQRWISAAREVLEGRGHLLPAVYYSRALWTWVLIAWGGVAGLTLESTAVLMFALSCITVLVIAEAARTLFGREAGILAAAIYATHPLAVIYDVQTLPDGLAVALLAAAILAFARFLKTGSVPSLAAGAFAVGLSYSAKSYFVLAALPMLGTVLAYPLGRGSRRRHAAWLTLCVGLGLVLTWILSRAARLAPNDTVSWIGSYARILAADQQPLGGSRALVTMLLGRLEYGRVLYFGYGIVIGFILLWATWLLVLRAKSSRECGFLLALVMTFLLFLSLTPVRLSPLLLVEMQDRYLMVILPALAAAGGWALWAVVGHVSDPRTRKALVWLLGVAFLYNLWVPNQYLDRHRLLEMEGLSRALAEAYRLQISELQVPEDFRDVIPDSYYSRGVRLSFRAPGHEVADPIRAAVGGAPSVAVFIPRARFRELMRTVRIEDCTPLAEYGGAAAFVQRDGTHYARIEIRVPFDSLRLWLERLGFQTKGQLVALLLVDRTAAPAAPSAWVPSGIGRANDRQEAARPVTDLH